MISIPSKYFPRLLLLIAVTFASTAQAGVVRVWGEQYNLNILNDFYDGLAGHSSQIANGQLDTVDLSGVDLLWAVQPSNAYTTAEMDTMASFLAGGGRIAFMGEHGQFMPDENQRINAALAYLGADISIQFNIAVDGGFRTASKGDGQILDHPLTDGVNSYQYAAFAPLNVSGTAEILMVGEDDPSTIMMAYQNIGAGSIFLITDQNVWDGAPGWPSHDNEVMFENLLVGETHGGGGSIPNPGALWLLGIGLIAVARMRRC